MSHSLHFKSMTIHYNGDYSGDYSINDMRRTGSGAISMNEFKEIKIDSIKFDKIARDIMKNKKIKKDSSLDVILHGENSDTGKQDNITVNSYDVVTFYLDKLRNNEIYKLESMYFGQLLKRYTK